jgi:hypothetical protein
MTERVERQRSPYIPCPAWVVLAALFLAVTDARAANSIVIGDGIEIVEVGEPLNDWVMGYVWLIDARQTISGPPVTGKVRIVAASHAQPTDAYLKTVQLFVLSPAISDGNESTTEPRFSLITSSPLYRGGKYCVPFKPSEIGIPLGDPDVEQDNDGSYCFTKKALLRASKNKRPS